MSHPTKKPLPLSWILKRTLSIAAPLLLGTAIPFGATAQSDETASPLALRPHPRLFITSEMLERVREEPQIAYLKAAAKGVAERAEQHVDVPPVKYKPDGFNAHLVRARECQKVIVDLVIQYKRTGDRRFRDAAIGYVRRMGEWEYWSWITWRKKNAQPDAIFDLSYGENSATLAIAYDILHDELSAEEKALFLDVARARPFVSGMKQCKEDGMWWFGRNNSNWNTACAGGLGMLCLAMYEDAPEARELLPRVEQSIEPFMKHLEETDGGWPEGLGYWNYGMRYGFMYLLSHENATGKPHPLMQLGGVRKTLRFPLDFTPGGTVTGFGDAGSWGPLPFHWAMASRMKDDDVLRTIHARLEKQGVKKSCWPRASVFLAVHPGRPPEPAPEGASEPVRRLYKGIDWGTLADRFPEPALYLAIRGGTTKVPHSHRDLLSFHCVVNGERLIRNIDGPPYIDTTFSSRREELFEVSPLSRNGLFINGVGITTKATLDGTEEVSLDGILGFRLESTTAMGTMRDGPAAKFCGRLALMLEGKAFLLVDQAILPQVGHFESRMHTYQKVEMEDSGAVVRGSKGALRIAYASNVPARAALHGTAPTLIQRRPSKMLRWATPGKYTRITFATLLSPGDGPADVSIAEENGATAIAVRIGDWTRNLHIEDKLLLKD